MAWWDGETADQVPALKHRKLLLAQNLCASFYVSALRPYSHAVLAFLSSHSIFASTLLHATGIIDLIVPLIL